MEFDPENGRIAYFHDDKKIEVNDMHYEPTFIANNIEEIR